MSQISVPISSLIVDSVLRDANVTVSPEVLTQLVAIADNLLWQNRAILAAHLLEIAQQQGASAPPKRRRGRPRKQAAAQAPDAPPMLKRRRGRPRKTQPVVETPNELSVSESEIAEAVNA